MWVVSLSVLCLAALAAGQTVAEHDQVVACYVSTWAVYRPEKGQFTLDNVNPALCTHIIYAFTGIEEGTFKMVSLDPQFDINRGGFGKAVSLKQRNPKLKVTVAVGGWIEGSEKYSLMASSAANRRAFIDSVVQFIQKHRFDGLDLDWEYPANRGGKPQDKENFVLLTKELNEVFSRRGWILTAAVGASKSVIDTAYDLPRLSMYLDFIHLMAYDYHGKWDLKTGHNAPLYPRADEIHQQSTLNVNYSVSYYLSKGVPADKFVLGLGVYGRTFMLNNTKNPGIGAPAMKTAFSGPYTREDGFLGYNEICEKQTTERGWSIAWQSAHQAPYMFKDNMWVSFDDTNSLGLKVAYAQRLGLAGVMVWSIDTDDFRGNCGQQKFPLLRAINKNMVLHKNSRKDTTETTTKKVVSVETSTKSSGVPLPDEPHTPSKTPQPQPQPPRPQAPEGTIPGDIPPQQHKPTGIPLPAIPPHHEHPSVEPLPPTPPHHGVPLPETPTHHHPHDDHGDHHSHGPHDHHDHDHSHGTHDHHDHDHSHDPSLYDDLDKDKPAVVITYPDQTNHLDDSRYYSGSKQEPSSASTYSCSISMLIFLSTILLPVNL